MDFMTGWEPSSSGTSTPQKQQPASSAASQGDHDAAGLGISSDSATSGSNNDAGLSTAKPAKPTLEQELEQMGNLVSGMSKNLGSYWGQFRRQSSTALKQSQAYAQSAAKDLTPFLDKAKAELDKLGEQAKASAAAGQAAALADGGSGGSIVNPDAPALIIPTPAENVEKSESQDGSNSKDKDAANEASASGAQGSTSSSNSPPLNAAAFFSRLQSQLSTNPNFQSFQSQFTTFQTDLKNRVAQSSSSGGTLDFSNIDFHEAKEKYEKAMSQGDKYFKIASKELTELLEGALKIVPPEEEAARKAAAQAVANAGGSKRKQDAAAAAAGRKETLLYRIRSDPAVMLVDPAQPPASTSASEASSESAPVATGEQSTAAGASHSDTREPFARFLQSIEDDGGLEGESWKGRVQAALSDSNHGSVIRQTYDSIVPSKISAEAFWTRYFFRIQQIEEDEARRREILEGAAQQDDDDFSWDMEDDSLSIAGDEAETAEALSSDDKGKSRELPTAASMETLKTPKPDVTSSSNNANLASSATTDDPEESWGISPIASGQASPVPSSAAKAAPESSATEAAAVAQSSRKMSSPRQSSEEGTSSSYDVISTTSADPTSTKTSPVIKKKDQADEEDEDSDWE